MSAHTIRFKLFFLAILAVVFVDSSSFAAVSSDRQWSYPEMKTIWHEALGPHNKDATAIIEGRTFSFKSTGGMRAKEYAAAEPIFEKALELARPHVSENPADVARCYVNFAIFQYLQGERYSADRSLKIALKIANSYGGKDSPLFNEILEYRAMVQRAIGGFSRHTGKKYYNRAELYYDHMQNSLKKTSSPNHPDLKHIRSHHLMARADAGEHTMEKEFDLEDAEFYTPSMMCIQGENTFNKMVAFAEDMIKKYTPHPEPEPVEPGLAHIVGNWSIQRDQETQISQNTSAVTTQKAGGITVSRRTSAEDKSRVADQVIYLCRQQDYGSIVSAIDSFGRTRALKYTDLSNTWPVTYKQADDLLKYIENVVEGIAVESQKTDIYGDFEFSNIPKGKYFLYAHLLTRQQATIWFNPIPTSPIVVTRVEQFAVNFDGSSGKVIWSRRPRDIRTRQPAGFPSSGKGNPTNLVPPPPPSIPSSFQMFQQRNRN